LILIKTKSARPHREYALGWRNKTAPAQTGTTNQRGMTFIDNNGVDRTQMKDFGIEDLWGNLQEFIDGVYLDQNRDVLTAFQNSNDTGTGYINKGPSAPSDGMDYLVLPVGTTEAGFIMKTGMTGMAGYNINSAPWYAYCASYANRVLFAGSAYNTGDESGPFRLFFNATATTRAAYIGSRLMYL